MTPQNIIVVFIRHFKNKKITPVMLYAVVNNNSSEPNWTSNEADAFVFNNQNILLYTTHKKQILQTNNFQQTSGIDKEEIAWKITTRPETKHESNNWVKEYIKKTPT